MRHVPLATMALLSLISSAAAAPTFGHAEESAVGDFNGDGLLDRVMAEPDWHNGRGRVRVFLGDGGQESLWFDDDWTNNVWTRDPITMTAADPIFGSQQTPGAAFGSAVTVGDFDDDGRDDIAFGAPGETYNGATQAGTVYVLYGRHLAHFFILGEAGYDYYAAAAKFNQGRAGLTGYAETRDYFGQALAAGDLNCDGVDDLVVGAPREDFGYSAVDAGVIHVILGSSPAGLTTAGNRYLAQSSLGGTNVGGDLFGAALTIGRMAQPQGGFQVVCNHLAIGAPGKDFNGKSDAGVVYVNPVSVFGGVQLQGTLWHQDMPGVDGTAAAHERFGAALGTVQQGAARGLWVQVPGEGCGDANETRFQVFNAGAGTLTTTGDRRFCSRHVPSLTETEAGWLVEKRDAFGPYLQYIPTTVSANSEVLVVIHGTPPNLAPGVDPTAYAARVARFYVMQPALIALAEARGLILIAPGFKHTSFAAAGLTDNHPAGELPDVLGGYRGLIGRDIQADDWVNLIVDSYDAVDLLPTGELYIYGQSAGAQMVSRYIARNADRVIKAAMCSPNTVARPDADVAWPSGLAPMTVRTLAFMDDALNGVIGVDYGFTPDADDWAAALTKPIFINVGELEQDDGDTHVATATMLRDVSADFMTDRNEVSQMRLCVVPNMDHDFTGMLPYALEQMFPTGNPLPCKVMRAR